MVLAQALHSPGVVPLASKNLSTNKLGHLAGVRAGCPKAPAGRPVHNDQMIARAAPAGATMPQPGATKTIYQRLGGKPAVQAAAELMYDKLLADPQLAPFFVGTDLGELVKHQVDFLTLVFSSKDPQRLAPSMARVHARLIREQGLNVQHFDMLAGHLGAALAELDAALHELAEPQDLVGVAGDVMAALGPLRPAFEAPAVPEDGTGHNIQRNGVSSRPCSHAK